MGGVFTLIKGTQDCIKKRNTYIPRIITLIIRGISFKNTDSANYHPYILRNLILHNIIALNKFLKRLAVRIADRQKRIANLHTFFVYHINRF